MMHSALVVLNLTSLALVLFLVAFPLRNTTTAKYDQSSLVRLPRDGGQIVGRRIDLEPPFHRSVYAYEGIRYGRAKRFERPTRAEPLNEATTRYRFACPQEGIPFRPENQSPIHMGQYQTGASSSEDCLFLSIWRPVEQLKANSSTDLKAVMVWLHGGSLQVGTAFSRSHDGRYLSSIGDVILVSINYRLGVLGFLYHSDDGSDSEDTETKLPGNQGLHDQILALEWVRDNIQAFGGDPKRVTLFGESAGSVAASLLVLASHNRTVGLFRRVILQSGAPQGLMSRNASLAFTRKVAQRLGCSSGSVAEIVSCLKNRTIPELVNVVRRGDREGLTVGPMYGDQLLLAAPWQALKELKDRKLDVMFGVTDQEMALMAEAFFPKQSNLTLESSTQALGLVMGPNININITEVVGFYFKNNEAASSDDPTSIRKAFIAAVSDYLVVCPTVLFGQALALAFQRGKTSENFGHKGSNSFYSYRLVQPISVPVYSRSSTGGVAGHGSDVLFLFGLPIALRGVGFTEAEYRLSVDMIRAWTQFAREGNPGKIGASGVEWESAFEVGKVPETRYMALQSGNYRMVAGAYKRSCDSFWKPRMDTGLDSAADSVAAV